MRFSITLVFSRGESVATHRLADAFEECCISAVPKGCCFTGSEDGPDDYRCFFEADKPEKLLEWLYANVPGPLRPECRAHIADGETFGAVAEARFEEFPQWKRPKPPRMPSTRIGDCFAVPLNDGSFGHLEYVMKELGLGDAVQVFELILPAAARIEEVLQARPAFPPVRIDVRSQRHAGGWQFIGNSRRKVTYTELRQRSSPGFSSSQQPGTYHDWFIRQGDSITHVGTLGENDLALEIEFFWLAESLEQRIRTGEDHRLLAR